MEYLLLLLSLVSLGTWWYYKRRYRKLYQKMMEMLDDILEQRQINQQDIKEGAISVLAGKGRRIQRKLEIEVGQAQEEREQVKQIISNMSHQLKTPLANILMYEELLEHRNLDPEQYRVFLKKLRRQSEKINWILQSLFKMMRLEHNVISFQVEQKGIRETLVEAVATIYESAKKKKIAITIESGEDVTLLHNRKWTIEVFVNLLENAIKYTEEGGKITIDFQFLEMYTGIIIEDTGMGIEIQEYQKIFERFYRSKTVENIEGAGIGLYLSKMILEKEKGYLTVKSHLGKGSCFTVFLQNCHK